MMLNPRTFLFSAPAGSTVRPVLQATPESTDMSSGGIGLTLAEVQALYDELPAGEGYRSFAEPDTATTLFIDFGEDDIARTIWVFGQLDSDSVASLVAQLCPGDAVIEHRFGMPQYAGSMADLYVEILHSESINEITGGRTKLMAKYTLLPGTPEIARDLIVSLELND